MLGDMNTTARIETCKANGGGWNVHVYLFGALVHTTWTAGSKRDANEEASRIKNGLTVVVEPFTFRDGSVRNAQVAWLADHWKAGERRCIAVRELGP